jgi:hypothetical protein
VLLYLQEKGHFFLFSSGGRYFKGRNVSAIGRFLRELKRTGGREHQAHVE